MHVKRQIDIFIFREILLFRQIILHEQAILMGLINQVNYVKVPTNIACMSSVINHYPAKTGA
jgi:hypothetical protein